MKNLYLSILKYFLTIALILISSLSFSQIPMGLEWEYYGPFNISGRTGQLLIDKNNPNLFILASSIGGIFKSDNAGDNWDKLQNYQGHSTVTSFTQAVDNNKTIFTGTGEIYFSNYTPFNSGRQGNGIWRSSNNGNTWENLSTTSSFLEDYPSVFTYNQNIIWDRVEDMKSNPVNPNVLLVTTSKGIAISENALDIAADVEFITVSGQILSSVYGQSVDIANDGSVAFATIGGRTFRSLDFQNNFKTGWEQMDSVGFGQRATVRIAPTNSNIVYAVVTTTSLCMEGFYRSLDKGNTWEKIINGGFPYDSDPFNDPLASAGECLGLGWRHQEMLVHPTDENIVFIGGETLYKWNGNDETFVQIDLVESQLSSINNLKYLPQGKHGLTFDELNEVLYISTNRGIYKSTSINETNVADIHFESVNNNLHNLNTYRISAGNTGEVLVGTQNNGNLLMCSEELPPPIGGEIIVEGNGGYTHISHFDPEYLFFSQPFGALKRSRDKGATFNNFLDLNIGKGCNAITCNLPTSGNCSSNGDGGFITVSHLMEVSNKSIQQPTAFLYSAVDTLNSGQHLAQSTNAPVEFDVALTNTLLPGDTAFFNDPYDAKYFVSSTCGIWMCSNPFDINPTFYRLTQGFNVVNYDHSFDGNHLYGVVGKNIIIISGFNELELDGNGSTTPLINQPSISLAQTNIELPGLLNLYGIAVDKNDPNHILVVAGGAGTFNKIWKITNALSANPIIEEIQNNLPSNIPLYDCVIDIQNSDNYIVASDFGIWASTNAGETWYQENEGLENAFPIYQIKQVKLYEEDCPVLYASIHGRGVARSLSLTPGFCDTEPACIEPLLKIDTEDLAPDDYLMFPNPTFGNLNLYFPDTLFGNTNVKVYNAIGNLLYSEQFIDLYQTEINVSYLTSGIYTVVIVNSNYNLQSKTFIKQ